MSNIIDKALELKTRIERRKQERDKAKGAYGQVMKQIQDEFGCKSLEQAEKLLTKMQKQQKQSKEQILKETEVLEKELDEHD